MLPIAPPMMRPTVTSLSRLAVRFTDSNSTTTITSATTPISGPQSWPRLNAMPVLYDRWNRSVQNTSMSRSSSVRTAHHLVSWSTTTTATATAMVSGATDLPPVPARD